MLATLGWAMRPEPAREQALAQAQSPELVLALALAQEPCTVVNQLGNTMRRSKRFSWPSKSQLDQ